MEPACPARRITYKRTRPNPHIEELLEQLYESAKAKKSREENNLKEALNSISKYPLPLESGDECSILKGFNSKLCSIINEQLKKWSPKPLVICVDDDAIQNHVETTSSVQQLTQIKNISSTSRSIKSNASHLSSQSYTNPSLIDSNPETVSPNVKSTNKIYKPKYRSGGYAILITLLENSTANPNKCSLTKEVLIEKAQKHCEESFSRPKPETFYSAWSNMTRLITKGLVLKTKNKSIEYSLTEQGKYTANELLKESAIRATINDIIFDDARNNNDDDVQSKDNDVEIIEAPVIQDLLAYNSEGTFIEMSAGSYDIILLIDKNETGGVSKRNDPTVAQFNKYPDLKHEYRSLKVGDFTWIARDKINVNQELVLPYVVERKRMDDLGASIKDGRFHEQKFRLRRCGLHNVIYMVEKYGSNKHVGLPIQSLMQALANTRIQDGFKVHMTDSLTTSTRFLAMMTKRLTIEYKNKHLRGCNRESNGELLMTFEYFNKSSSKTKPLTVTETFIKILLQLKGMSVEKALAITNKFSTPRALIEAYKGSSKKDGEFLLANLKYGSLNRNVGPSISKPLYQLFCSHT